MLKCVQDHAMKIETDAKVSICIQKATRYQEVNVFSKPKKFKAMVKLNLYATFHHIKMILKMMLKDIKEETTHKCKENADLKKISMPKEITFSYTKTVLVLKTGQKMESKMLMSVKNRAMKMLIDV